MGAQPAEKGHNPQPIFGQCLLWPIGWMVQDATWYGGKPRPRRRCVMGSQTPPPGAINGANPPFSAYVYCGQKAGWMKAQLGTEVDLGPGHIVLDGDSAPCERGTAAPVFSAHVYCGHGGPSQLLLTAELLFRSTGWSIIFLRNFFRGPIRFLRTSQSDVVL